MDATAISSDDPGIKALIKHLESVFSVVLSLLKWILVLNFAVLWLAFSLNVVRIHLTMGDVADAIVSAILFIGPLGAVVLWWAVQKSNLTTPELFPTQR